MPLQRPGEGRESSPACRASIQNKSPEAARRLAALLVEPAPKGSGRSAVVTESWAADSLLTRMRVGPFADRWEAAAKLREMETLGYKPFIATERE